MFDSALSWALTKISDGLDSLLAWLLGVMNMNVSFFTKNFPILTQLYGIIQAVGIGLAIAIALFQLSKFLTGSLNGSRSTPIEILVRLGLSIGLIFFGNYFLEAVMNLFSYPHQALLNVTSLGSGYNNVFGAISLSNELSAIIAFFFICIVGWNVLKLALEVVERFLMIGVLLYLSPLAWSAATSRESQPILSKYLSMFLGQCILMLLSVWSIKMVINILGYSESNVMLSMIFALAFCKIAQRFDTYLKSMGINAAHTGSSWLDDIVIAGKAVSGIAGVAAKTSGNNVLGDAFQKGGVVAGTAVGASQFGRFVSSGIRNKANNGINISKNATGGGFTVTDAVGGLSVAAGTRREANKLSSIVQSARAMYNGESNLTQDEKGMYNWTDANGQQHQFKNLNDALRTQEAIRNNYDPSQVSKIDTSNNIGYSATADNVDNSGVVLNSSAPGDNINDLSNVYAERVLNKDGSINESAINSDNNTFNTTEGVDTALTISAIAGLGSLNGHTAQQMSEMSANTISAQGSATAATLMNIKQGNNPITDEKVVSATYNKLFDNDLSRKELDGWMPGFTEAADANALTNLHMGNGEIGGVYSDESGTNYDFSIISQNAYDSLPNEQQVDYQPIQGADGSMYYANVAESTAPNSDSSSNGGISNEPVNTGYGKTTSVQAEHSSLPNNSGMPDYNTSAPVVEVTSQSPATNVHSQNKNHDVTIGGKSVNNSEMKNSKVMGDNSSPIKGHKRKGKK